MTFQRWDRWTRIPMNSSSAYPSTSPLSFSPAAKSGLSILRHHTPPGTPQSEISPCPLFLPRPSETALTLPSSAWLPVLPNLSNIPSIPAFRLSASSSASGTYIDHKRQAAIAHHGPSASFTLLYAPRCSAGGVTTSLGSLFTVPGATSLKPKKGVIGKVPAPLS